MILAEPEVQAALDEGRPLTHQEAFNVVWRKFVVEAQGPCFENNRCKYRSDDGSTACAIGWLVPDSVETFENAGSTPISWLILAKHRYEGAKRLLDDGNFYDDLQQCHDIPAQTLDLAPDGDSFTDYMRKSLLAFAHRYDLSLPEGGQVAS